MKYISYTLLGIFISLLLSCANGPTASKVNHQDHQVKFKPFTLNAKFYDVDGSPINGLKLKLYNRNFRYSSGSPLNQSFNKDGSKSGTTDLKGFVSLKGLNYRSAERKFWEFDLKITDNPSSKNYATGNLMNVRDIISNTLKNKDTSMNVTFNESFENSVHIINLEFKLGFKPKYFNGAFDIFPKKLISEIYNLSDTEFYKSFYMSINDYNLNAKLPSFNIRKKVVWDTRGGTGGIVKGQYAYDISNFQIEIPSRQIRESNNKINATFKFYMNNVSYEKKYNFLLNKEDIEDKQTFSFSLPLRLYFKDINNQEIKDLTLEYETADGVRRVKTDNSGVIEVNVHDIKYPFKIRNQSKDFIIEEKILVNKKSDLKEIEDFIKTVRVHESFKTVNAIVKLTSYENMVPESCNIKAYVNYYGDNGDTKEFVDIKNNDRITFKITRNKLETKDIAVRFYVNNQKYFSLAKVLNFNFDDQNNYLLEFKLDHPKFYISQDSRTHLWEILPNRNNINNIIYELILNDKLISDKYQFEHGCIKYKNNNLLIDMTSRNSYNTKIYTERKLAGFLFDDYIRKVVRKTNDNLQGISNLAAIHTNIAHSKRDFSNSSDTDQVNDCIFLFNLTDTKKYVDYDITGREFLKISRIIYNGERIEPDLN